MRRGIRSAFVILAFVLVGTGLPTTANATNLYLHKKEQKKEKTVVTVCKYFAPYSAEVKTSFTVKNNGYTVARLWLKNDCERVKIKTNKYGKAYVDVTGYVPYGCYLKSIKSYGKPYVDKHGATAWINLKKGDHVKVVFTDFCKKLHKERKEHRS
jgi:hypothetical protein